MSILKFLPNVSFFQLTKGLSDSLEGNNRVAKDTHAGNVPQGAQNEAQEDGSAGKVLAAEPDKLLHTQDPYGGKRELTTHKLSSNIYMHATVCLHVSHTNQTNEIKFLEGKKTI